MEIMSNLRYLLEYILDSDLSNLGIMFSSMEDKMSGDFNYRYTHE